MINRNIQMKKKNNNQWENLFPLTLNENVFNTEGIGLTKQLNKINETLKRKINNVINVSTYNTIDEAINKAILKKQDNLKPTLFFTGENKFYTDKTITIPSDINVIMESPIHYTGVRDEPILTIGEKEKNNQQTTLVLQVKRDNKSDWLNEKNIGINLINVTECDITIILSQDNTIGVNIIGDGTSSSYNNFKLFGLVNNKIALNLTNKNKGWVNENNFYGGRFWNTSSANKLLDRIGVRITSIDGLYKNNNNNIFYKPSFELGKSDNVETIPILIEHGNLNKFINARNEFNGEFFARFLNKSYENLITTGYDSTNIKIDNQSEFSSNTKMSARNEFKTVFNKLIFHSGVLADNAYVLNGRTNIPNMMVTNNQRGHNIDETSITINENNLSLETTRGIGVRIKGNNMGQILFKHSGKSRVGVVCYDKNKNPLHSETIPYVKGGAMSKLFYRTTFDNIYLSSEIDTDIVLQFHSDVVYADIFSIGGTIGYFSLYTELNNPIEAFNPFEDERELSLINLHERLKMLE